MLSRFMYSVTDSTGLVYSVFKENSYVFFIYFFTTYEYRKEMK